MAEHFAVKELTPHGKKDFPISVYCVARDEEDVLGYHWHDEAEFIYLKKGDVTFYIDAVPVILHEGEAAFVQSGQIHGAEMEKSRHCEFYSIVFKIGILSSSTIGSSLDRYVTPLIDRRISLPGWFGFGEYDLFVITHLKRIIELFSSRAPGYEMAVVASLYLIVSEIVVRERMLLTKNSSTISEQFRIERFKHVLDFIHGNFNRKISIADMAQVIDMSSYYFCRFFKSLSGKTPFEYLNAYRINMAALWLRQTDSKVTEIAYDAGFPISVILSNCSERQRAVRQRLSVLNVDCFVTTSLP